MYYKLLKENQIIDILENPVFVRCKKANNRLVKCKQSDAEGVVSNDGKIWHVEGWERSPAFNAESIKLFEISYEEYEQLSEALAGNQQVSQPEESISYVSVDKVTQQTIRSYCIEKMRKACADSIIQGFDITDNGNLKHYDLTLEDQINLISLIELINAGVESVPYHAKGEPATLYSAQDIRKVASEATKHRIYHTTYYNCLKNFIEQLDVNNLERVYYGIEIPEEYQTEALKALLK